MNSRRNIRKPFAAILFAAIVVFSAVAVMCTTASAATDDEIETSIEAGLAWLASEQGVNGNWDGGGGERDIGATGLALLKFIEYAKENDMDPNDPDYIYSDNVIKGMEFLDTTLVDHPVGISMYDGNSNGNMVSLGLWMPTYNTGIGAMAYAANPNTPPDLVQDLTDWLVNAQCTDDTSLQYGAWSYSGFSCWGDNSNTGYAALGLGYALNSGATIPDSTRTALSAYVDYIQNDPGVADDGFEDDPDGGSGYYYPDDWVNSLKTGNLIYEALLSGDDPDSQRILDATDYLHRHWNDNVEGWMGNMPTYNTQYQATYSIMKGLESIGMDDLNGIDWFDEISTEIVADQNECDGSWSNCPNYVWAGGSGASISTDDLCTTWALLTLEKVIEKPVIEVYMDVKPGSCPNPINPVKKGVTPVAILGTEDFDVMTIDPATVELTLEDMDEGVSPLRWDYEDVATPFDPVDDECCHDLNRDGYMDLTLKFDTQELVSTLGLEDYAGETIQLKVSGNLMEEFSGTPIMGEDCVWILDE